MAKTIVGLYDDMVTAQQVLTELQKNGFRREDISLLANDAKGEYGQHMTTETTTVHSGKGMEQGATAGAMIGGIAGLLVGLGALAIPGVGPIIAAGPIMAALVGAGIGAATGGLIGALTDVGVPEQEAHYYAEGVRQGGTLVAVNSPDDKGQLATNVMNRFNPINVEERATQWRQNGWQGVDNQAKTTTNGMSTPMANTTTAGMSAQQSSAKVTQRIDQAATTMDKKLTDQGKTVLPVVEEEIEIQKRQVQGGGVRVETTVTEKPVEETVSLRKETVEVERHPVDRPVNAADLNAFKEATIEVTETSEEAVVQKQARVVEEVVVQKNVENKTETVHDTVKRTDVHVEDLGKQAQPGTAKFDTYESKFRTHYTTAFANKGRTYEQYQPAYRTGFDLAGQERYRGRDWNQIETDVQRDWNQRNPNNSWQDFKDAVHEGWNALRGQR